MNANYGHDFCSCEISLRYIASAVAQYNVEKIAGAEGFEHTLGNIAHYGLYAFMTIMPATGIAMGYYGGWYFRFDFVLFW